MKKSIFVVFIIALGTFALQAQQVQLKGQVTAFNTYGLKKVTVETSKSKQIVLTDSVGEFVITYNTKKDRLKVTAEGFSNQYLSLKGDTVKTINLVFKESKKAAKQAVAAGHISANDLEFGVKFKKDDNNNFASYRDIYDMIQSMYPRVSINGATGEKMLYLTSRGPQSLTSGEEALLVVDGMVMSSVAGLSPMQVERINVLVGVGASAYGTRGGCGVIEIFMKH